MSDPKHKKEKGQGYPKRDMLPDTPMPHCHGKWDSIGSNLWEAQSCMRV